MLGSACAGRAAAAAALLFCGAPRAAAPRRRVAVSGQSAGGSMAVQHLVAFSGSVDGAGVAAGSPYGCGSLRDAGDVCSAGPIDVDKATEHLSALSAAGLIDDPANLRRTAVVLFLGGMDQMVYMPVMEATKQQLALFVDRGLLTSVFNTSAAHVWSRDHGHCDCGTCEFFWGLYHFEYYQYDHDEGSNCCDVNNCGYDFAGDLLRRTYGAVRPRARARRAAGAAAAGGVDLWWVDQHAHLPPRGEWREHGLTRWGLVYVATACRAAPDACRVHVTYHGCMSPTGWAARRQLASVLDLNEYAEANNMIVLYPQATKMKEDPWGCWNWMYTEDDPLYDSNQSVQLRTVVSMVDDLNNMVHGGEFWKDARPPSAADE